MIHHFTLERVQLDRQGRDRLGCYYGAGEPVFHFATADNGVHGCVRGKNRAAAIEALRARYPGCAIGRGDKLPQATMWRP